MILPVVWMLDIFTVAPIVLTASVLISADLENRVESVSVDVVKEGRVGLFWMTGTHWPKLWMVETLLLMLRGSETDRTQ
jgi:hypothetical protein